MRTIEQQLPKLSEAEILSLAARLIAVVRARASGHNETDLSHYSGILSAGPDPLEFQKQIRSEWDRD